MSALGPLRWWKLVGLAGIAGVAATGIVIARSERRRRAYTPDEVRSRLHDRYAQVQERDRGVADQRPGRGREAV